jgi:hypothetical protein
MGLGKLKNKSIDTDAMYQNLKDYRKIQVWMNSVSFLRFKVVTDTRQLGTRT